MAVVERMAKDHGAVMHPFFLPKNSIGQAAEPGFDQNEGRRKRQRIASTESVSAIALDSVTIAWADQLKAAASSLTPTTDGKGPSNATESEQLLVNGSNGSDKGGSQHASAAGQGFAVVGNGSIDMGDAQASSTTPQRKLEETPPKKLLRVRPDGKLGSPKADSTSQAAKPRRGRKSLAVEAQELENTHPNDHRASIMQQSHPEFATDLTPTTILDATIGKGNGQPSTTNDEEVHATWPENLLRVRPDGKLAPLKANGVNQDAKPRRGGRSAKTAAVPQTLLATIRYGLDDASHLSLGRKIEAIFSDVLRVTNPAENKPLQAAEPLKVTHPFFLGGSTRLSAQHHQNISDDQKKPETQDRPSIPQRKNISPRKTRVICKPTEIAENHTPAIAFGFNTFGSDHARISRFPGTVDPLWPPADMLHVGRSREAPAGRGDLLHDSHTRGTTRKLKDVEVRVPEEEDIFNPYVRVVKNYRAHKTITQKTKSLDWRNLRRPLRRLMTGRELQKAVRPRLASYPSFNASADPDMDELSILQPTQSSPHSALRRLYESIATSLSAFDKSECETQDWMHKYAPKSVEDVLQQSHEVVLLRDWLKGLIIKSVECRDGDKLRTRDSSVASGRRCGKRKRKRAEELDGFLVSSDEEPSLMDEIADPEDFQPSNTLLRRSVVRSRETIGSSGNGERSTNAVVISGPHGCGKTAAVYAVAQELGFEVFEINSASRRNGRDILDRVGDMARNHLVRHDQQEQGPAKDHTAVDNDTDEQQRADEKLKQDLESGRQGIMNSFVKSTRRAKEKQPTKESSSQKVILASKDQPKKKQDHKQSLILLEEVDVLFDEDKMFWATVFDLITQSKRPIVMTCTDESLLPIDDMALYAIFRFGPPAEQLAVDYLMLIACNEGHLLPRGAISALYLSKHSDLRASIAELNFFCQMAIGDTKGGLEWMLIPSSGDYVQDQKSEILRVVSDGTYQSGMGWLGSEFSAIGTGHFVDQETKLLSEACNGWEVKPGAVEEYTGAELNVCPRKTSRSQGFEALQDFDRAFEALSAADIFPSCVSREPDMVPLETAQPKLTEKARSSYIEGLSILQADPIIDQTGLSNSLALTLRACAQRLLHHSYTGAEASPLSEQGVIDIIARTAQGHGCRIKMTISTISPAFDPIARSQQPILGIPRGPQISSFDAPISVIATDLAPYVRSIVSYDLRLEDQRRQLSSLLFYRGKDGKKTRTTRASRAALEGGNKANTRRERWFPTQTSFDAVLRSGGKDWQSILFQRTVDETSANGTVEEGSRRPSLGSAGESDG